MNFISTFEELNKLYEEVEASFKPIAYIDLTGSQEARKDAYVKQAKADGFTDDSIRFNNDSRFAEVCDAVTRGADVTLYTGDDDYKANCKRIVGKKNFKVVTIADESIEEAFDTDSGATNWSQTTIGYYKQAAKELGLANFNMKLSGYGKSSKVLVTAEKSGKALKAETTDEAATHEIRSIEDAKDFIQYIFPELLESVRKPNEMSEAFENENGAKNWNDKVIGYFTQAAKELGLANYDMKLTGFGKDAKVVVTAIKDGKKLFAEVAEDQTHSVKDVEDTKEFIKYIFPNITESITEATENEFVEDEIPAEESRPLILECDKCGALVIKDEADIVADEESDLVNIEDECQFCEEAKGYKIVGVMVPYETTEEPTEELPEDEPAEIEIVEDEELEELFDANVTLDARGFGGSGNDVSVL